MPRREQFLAVLPPRYRAQVEAQLSQPRGTHIPGVHLSPISAPALEVEAKPSERRVRQSRVQMNKLELAYQDMLRVEFAGKTVIPQKVRIWLANGSWFKPDFFIPHINLFIEVKGPHAFRGGFEFLKIAASEHDWASFRLVWKKNGSWYRQNILSSEVGS